MRITLETDRDGRAALLCVHDVDTVTAGPLVDMLAVAQMAGALNVVIDLRCVDRLDLRACAALARAARARLHRCREHPPPGALPGLSADRAGRARSVATGAAASQTAPHELHGGADAGTRRHR